MKLACLVDTSAERESLAKVLASELRAGDLCLTLGAGDITVLADEILPLLEQGSAL